MERRLRYFAHVLAARPAFDVLGADGDNPAPWLALLSASLSPLALKHHDRMRIVDSLDATLGRLETYR